MPSDGDATVTRVAPARSDRVGAAYDEVRACAVDVEQCVDTVRAMTLPIGDVRMLDAPIERLDTLLRRLSEASESAQRAFGDELLAAPELARIVALTDQARALECQVGGRVRTIYL